MVLLILTVARILSHVVEAHHFAAAERGSKDRRVARHREVAEALAGNAGDAVKRVRLSAVIDAVVEEGAELGAGCLSRGVSDRLNDAIKVEFRGQDAANTVEGLDELRVVTGSLPGAHQVGDFDSMHEDIFDVAITIVEGFVHEVYVRLVELAVTAPVKQRSHFVTDKALTGGPNAVKDPDKRLIRDFWQGFKQWFANELLSPLADKTQVQRIRKFEPVLPP